MSLSDDKRNIFTTIGSYTSVMSATKMPDATNSFSSINNKKEIVPFLLDILKVVAGTDALQQLTGQLFTKFIDKIEPQLKSSLKNQTAQYNAGGSAPTYFQAGGTGVNVKVKDLDVNGKLKTDPTSQGGNLIYDTDPSHMSFDTQAYNAIKNGNSTFGVMNMKYQASSDEMIFNMNGSSPSIGKWSDDYIDSLKLINKKEFISNVMNQMYGTVSKSQGKTVNEALQELTVNALINQMINDNDSFEISPEDNAALIKRAEEMINGIVNYDMGCGVMAASLPISGLTSLINNISGSTDPNYVGNQLNDVNNQSIANKDVASANQETIKDGFFHKLILMITQALAQAMTTTPQIRALLSIISAFQHNGQTQIGSPKDDLKNFKILLSCLIKTVMKLLNEFIFDLIKVFLVKLLVPLIQAITKEKTTQYSGVLKSLMPSSPTTDFNSPEPIIGAFTKTLNLSSVGGPPTVPTPLILVGVPQRSGLSPLKMASNVIAGKTKAGLPVGVLPSGGVSPDEIMERIRMEEIVRAFQQDVVITVAIPPGITLQASGIGPTGPVTVFGSTIRYAKGYGVIQ